MKPSVASVSRKMADIGMAAWTDMLLADYKSADAEYDVFVVAIAERRIVKISNSQMFTV